MLKVLKIFKQIEQSEKEAFAAAPGRHWYSFVDLQSLKIVYPSINDNDDDIDDVYPRLQQLCCAFPRTNRVTLDWGRTRLQGSEHWVWRGIQHLRDTRAFQLVSVLPWCDPQRKTLAQQQFENQEIVSSIFCECASAAYRACKIIWWIVNCD